MKRRAVYPGTFDPVTYGHIDIIKRANHIFDEVIVAVAAGHAKDALFPLDKRMEMLKKATKDLAGVIVKPFDGLVVDYVRSQGIKIIIRGLRMISDFEYEFQMALTNRKLNPDIETIFMMPNESYSYLSSKLIKEIAALGASVREFVPEYVERELKEMLQHGVIRGNKKTRK